MLYCHGETCISKLHIDAAAFTIDLTRAGASNTSNLCSTRAYTPVERNKYLLVLRSGAPRSTSTVFGAKLGSGGCSN